MIGINGLLDGYFFRWCPIYPSHGTVTPTPGSPWVQFWESAASKPYCLVVFRPLSPLLKMMEWVRQLGWWNSQLNGKSFEIPWFQTTKQHNIFGLMIFKAPLQLQCARSRLKPPEEVLREVTIISHPHHLLAYFRHRRFPQVGDSAIIQHWWLSVGQAMVLGSHIIQCEAPQL